MATGKNRVTGGIVLSEMDYQESSKILHLYTEKLGKISVIARGALRARSPMISLTQTGTHAVFYLRPGRSFYYLQGGKLIDSHLELRDRYRSMIASALLLEIVHKTTLEGRGNPKIYGLLSKSLAYLNKYGNETVLITAFIIKYISYMGYRPHLKAYQTMSFARERGGIVEGSASTTGGVSIDQEELSYLNHLLLSPIDHSALSMEWNISREKLMNLMISYLQYNLDVSKFFSLELWI